MRIAVVSTTLLGGDRPTGGFEHRYTALVEAWAEAHTVNIVYLDDGTLGRAVHSRLSTTVVEVPPYPATRVGQLVASSATVVGYRRRAQWRCEADRAVASAAPDIVVQFLGFDPQLALGIGDGYPTLLFAEEDFTRSWDSAVRRLSWSYAADHIGRAMEARAWPRQEAVAVISERERPWATRAFPEATVVCVPPFVGPEYEHLDETPVRGTDIFMIGEFNEPRNAIGLRDLLCALDASGIAADVGIASRNGIHPLVGHSSSAQIADLGRIERPAAHYRAARMCVIPAPLVSGVKMQVLQGWATRCAVVASQPAADSAGAIGGHDAAVGSTPAQLVGHLERLLGDSHAREALSTAGAETLRRRFSRDLSITQADRALVAALATTPSRAA